MGSMTIHSVLQSLTHDPDLQKHKLEQPDWWLAWPPDVFALTSILLSQTGAYRYWVTPIKLEERGPANGNHNNPYIQTFNRPADQKNLESTVCKEWLERTTGQNTTPQSKMKGFAQVEECLASLFTEYKTTPINVNETPNDEDLKIIGKILWLHSVADSTCEHFGMLASGFGRNNLAFLMAHLILDRNKSLSRLPRQFGVVLPKLHTPQRGLTLRSASHHLSFHRTEVEVVWRSFPWINREQQQINALLIPWPFQIDAKMFKPSPAKSKTRATNGNYEFFRFGTGSEWKLQADGKIATDENDELAETPSRDLKLAQEFLQTTHDLIRQTKQQVNRVHALVFPELSTDPLQLNALLESLVASNKTDIPVVIAGLRSEGRNQLAVCAYFYDRWYVYLQEKHHRWAFDAGQVDRYHLKDQLKGDHSWWEEIDVVSRRLTFFNPTNWLTLAPLICEDLAQIEPVSDLIRGVGPNFLLALLLDGPQLTTRWSARHAAVFANDPGTSVLTLTSLGMVSRSREIDKPKDRSVALWNQTMQPAKSIPLEHDEHALLLTLKAEYKEEFSLDGRSDNGSACHLEQSDVLRIQKGEQGKRVRKKYAIQTRAQAHQSWDQKISLLRSDLTLLSFCADTMLEAPDDAIMDMKCLIGLEGVAPKSKLPPSLRGYFDFSGELHNTFKDEPDWINRFEALFALMLTYRQESSRIDWERNNYSRRIQDLQGLLEQAEGNIDQAQPGSVDTAKYVGLLLAWAIQQRVLRIKWRVSRLPTDQKQSPDSGLETEKKKSPDTVSESDQKPSRRKSLDEEVDELTKSTNSFFGKHSM
jgi:hypothetical protein